jgi:hypothetical protein
MYETYADQGLTVISVIEEDAGGNIPDADDAAEWRDQFGLTFVVMADTDESWSEAYMRKKGEHGNYLLDGDGRITWRQYGHADRTEVESEITALLAE